jgi:hypothetical protein
MIMIQLDDCHEQNECHMSIIPLKFSAYPTLLFPMPKTRRHFSPYVLWRTDNNFRKKTALVYNVLRGIQHRNYVVCCLITWSHPLGLGPLTRAPRTFLSALFQSNYPVPANLIDTNPRLRGSSDRCVMSSYHFCVYLLCGVGSGLSCH